VIVTRATEYEELLRRHGTREQARFFLASRGRQIEEVEERHRTLRAAVDAVLAAVPLRWRRALVPRADLDRFLFEPEDVVVAVGQDGLVANVAKYLDGQVVIGVNPSRALFDGVLVQHAPEEARHVLPLAAEGKGRVEARTLVEARTSDGQRLVALNEIFVGHRSHQSARYALQLDDRRERQASSGLIVATGTGATGWARSITRARREAVPLPPPASRDLIFLVREAFPSVTTGAALTEGTLAPGAALRVTSEMNDGGVVFGDGIEDDHLDFHWGQDVTIEAARAALRLLAA
jgi:NAD kinase